MSRVSRTLRVQPLAATSAGRLVTLTLRMCAVAILLNACDTPIGSPPPGTYLGKAIVTNPDGGGPQVLRYGPPQGWGGGGGA